MHLLQNLGKKVTSSATTEKYFYFLLFGTCGYIGSKQFLELLPKHDLVFSLVQIVCFVQLGFFFYFGPMVHMVSYLGLGIVMCLTNFVGAIIFNCKYNQEKFNGKGKGFWIYYFTRKISIMVNI